MAEKVEFVIKSENEGMRIDKLLTLKMDQISRSRVQQLISKNKVLLNGQAVKSNSRVRAGDQIEVTIPEPEPMDTLPEAIPLDIVYEDQDLLVINKPQGMVVHPAPGNRQGTLVNALLHHCQDLSGIGGTKRPGIIHRIDKDTSGLLVIAKNDATHLDLAAQIKEHSIDRVYLTIVHGVIAEPAGIVEAPIGRDPGERKRMAVVRKNSKPAFSKYFVKERYEDFTFLEVSLKTGRTHQIRVHLAYIHHPVLGDPKYGPKKNPFGVKTQVLHAFKLGFVHPRTKERLEFKVPLPKYFARILTQLRSGIKN